MDFIFESFQNYMSSVNLVVEIQLKHVTSQKIARAYIVKLRLYQSKYKCLLQKSKNRYFYRRYTTRCDYERSSSENLRERLPKTMPRKFNDGK